MKRVFFLFFFVFLFIFIYKIIDTVLIKIRKNDSLVEVPNFTFETMEGNILKLKDMEQNNWSVFLFFGTGCHFCEQEAKELKSLLTEIQNVHFYWISDEPKSLIKNFEVSYGFQRSDKVTFLQDKSSKEIITWGVSTIPQFIIYSPKGKLVKNHQGTLGIKKLLIQIENEFKTP